MSLHATGPGLHRQNINVVLLGDSHWNGTGQSATPVTETSGFIGTQSLMTPLDKMWTGTADASVFIADTQINSLTTPNVPNDPKIALGTLRGGPGPDMVTILRRAYPQLGRIRLANFGVGGSSTYTWAGEQAYGYIGAFLQATAGDTVTVAGQTYTFRAAPSVANEVLIGANANTTNLNLAYAINADPAQTAVYGAGTVANTSCWVPIPQNTQFERIMARANGTAGNSLALASSSTVRISACNAGLGGVSTFNLLGGSATSALYANAKSLMPAGFGTPDVFLIALGTNDASRYATLGQNVQTLYQTLIANIQTDYPTAKIAVTRPPTLSGTAGTAMTATILPAIDALIAANPTLLTMDMNTLGAGGTASASNFVRILSSDGIHLTQYGYSLWSQLMAAAVATGLGLT